MELLIIGIDGGTTEIFDAFDMPFWRGLRTSGVLSAVTEDLNERGWAKMISGKGASETGGLYLRPKLDGTRDFTVSFGHTELAETPDYDPLWRVAERVGHRVGVMNIPTTFPAPEVDGFFVSGGGGGVFQGGLPAGAVTGDGVEAVLAETSYAFDIRLGAEGFSDADTLCAAAETMMMARTEAFVRLAEAAGIGFGFLVYRATTVLQYLAMSEIAHAMRHAPGDPQRCAWSSPWLERLDRHYAVLDRCLARLFETLSPRNFIIVSDHSHVPWTHDVDYSGLLAACGAARFKRGPKPLARNLARVALRKSYRARLANVPLGTLPRQVASSDTLDPACGRAFSEVNCYGIYVNDAERFGGPVPAADAEAEAIRLCDDINWTCATMNAPFRAEPYRARFAGGPMERCLPDITMLQSGHAFPRRLGAHWYAPNPNFAPVRDIRGVGGMHSGQKGRHPIFLANPELMAKQSANDPADLRMVHGLTKALFGQ